MNSRNVEAAYPNKTDRRIIQEDFMIRKRGGLLHVCLNSPGCRFHCMMCNYGRGYMLTEDKADAVLRKIEEQSQNITSILIGTLGSVLDSAEITRDFLEKLCRGLNRLNIATIVFETHYTTVTRESCRLLQSLLPEKDVVIEIGLESADSEVLEKCLHKQINIKDAEKTIELIHEYGFSVTANVFLGAPFLSPREQVDDSVETVRWAIRHSVDSVVIFPANIRKNTLLESLYKQQRYDRIMHWQVLETLQRIPEDYLNRIYLSWFGDWIDYDPDGTPENIPPYACEACAPIWQEFYCRFLSEPRSDKRKQLLLQFESRAGDCSCRRQFRTMFERGLGR